MQENLYNNLRARAGWRRGRAWFSYRKPRSSVIITLTPFAAARLDFCEFFGINSGLN
jgi:hypothetical protein